MKNNDVSKPNAVLKFIGLLPDGLLASLVLVLTDTMMLVLKFLLDKASIIEQRNILVFYHLVTPYLHRI